jgi:ATP-binding cassette subfamily F protein uup
LLDEPANDLDIPALEVLEDSLVEFPGALVLVSHDRDLTDRVCTEVVGLDGRGGAALYGSLWQWLAASAQVSTKATKPSAKPAQPVPPHTAPAAKPHKLSHREQKELESMEAAILAAEAVVVNRQREVEQAATAGHAALAEACRALEETQRVVETLYGRWQELDAKRGP